MTWIRASSLVVAVSLVVLSAVTYVRGGDPDEVHDVLPRGAIRALFPRSDEFRRVDESSKELVLGFAHGGEARAYPIGLLNFHEIVNDEVGGLPIAATWCPLCATGIVFERRVDNQVLTFVVSGKLLRNNLVMSDEETRSLWPQLTGRAIEGPLEGTQLTVLPSTLLPWSEFAQLYPNATVLAPGGNLGGYSNPYAGYEREREALFPIGHDDPALFTKDLVYGVSLNGEHRAYPQRTAAQRQVFQDSLGGVNVTGAYWEGAASFFASSNRTFAALDGPRMVANDGTIWHRLTGQRQIGVNWTDERLERLVAIPSYWFAWKDFHPDTTIYEVSSRPGSSRWVGFYLPADYFTLATVVVGFGSLVFSVRAVVQRFRPFRPGAWRRTAAWPAVVGLVGGAWFSWQAAGATSPAYVWGLGVPAMVLIVFSIYRLTEALSLRSYVAVWGPWDPPRWATWLAQTSGSRNLENAQGRVGVWKIRRRHETASGDVVFVTKAGLLRQSAPAPESAHNPRRN